jgi:SAM-dependent methyltransferase
MAADSVLALALGRLRRALCPIPYPRPPDGKLNLHLGCGRVNHPRFVNIDLRPFRDGSVDLIYASHCLEHFSHHDVPAVLEEWWRVLKVGGILRLSVPDFDMLLQIYQACNNDLDCIQEFLMGGQDHKYNFHLTSFNAKTLRRILRASGFQEVREWIPGTDLLNTFDDFSSFAVNIGTKTYRVSLYLEARK